MDTEAAVVKWQAVGPRQRRVLGVLIEKAKTTPDAYPMTLNGLTTGCNQKNNRDPAVNDTTDDVEQALSSRSRRSGRCRRCKGAGGSISFGTWRMSGSAWTRSRPRSWRSFCCAGEQTVGELRGRASRMEPIADLNTLKPILNSLIAKNLVLSLSAEGRGQVVSRQIFIASRNWRRSKRGWRVLRRRRRRDDDDASRVRRWAAVRSRVRSAAASSRCAGA